jgi:hypothetical protein
MDFNLTEEQLMIQQAARDFAQTELLSGVIERDEFSKFPTDKLNEITNLGNGCSSAAFIGCAGLKYCNEETKINILFHKRIVVLSVYQSQKLVLMLLQKKR